MVDPGVPFGDIWVVVASVGGVWVVVVVVVYLVMDVAPSGAGVCRPRLQAELRCRQAPAMRLSVLGPIGCKLQRKTRLAVWATRDPRNRRVSDESEVGWYSGRTGRAGEDAHAARVNIGAFQESA